MAHPPVLDEQVALWAARLVAPTHRADPVEVARLRAEVAADLPDIDAAARQWTRLGTDLPPTEVRVIGRIGWVRANLAALQGAFAALQPRLQGRRTVVSRVLGAQTGALLGLLSTKVLGQFVLPLAEGEERGELVVVGPNVLELADREPDLARDVRRTILLHEVTHRLQFDATPWLAGHLRGLLADYLAHARLDGAAALEIAPRLPQAIVRMREVGTIEPIMEAVLTPDQMRIIQQAQGLMTLLEGHGNAAMFDAPTHLIADSDGVREALERRRGDVTSRVLGAVAGMEMKRRQYREGEAFVRGVIDRAGIDGLNRAFERPEHLPGADEVNDPHAWLSRVSA